jgi:hypothetical protein
MVLFEGMPDEYDPIRPNDYTEACKERLDEIALQRHRERGTLVCTSLFRRVAVACVVV